MSDDQTTPARLNPRYYVEVEDATHVYVRDAWTDRDIRTFRVRPTSIGIGTLPSVETAKLAAETFASEMNAPLTALEFVSRLALYIESSVNEAEEDRGNVLEDVSRLLEHYIGQLRGLKREPLDMTRMYVQAPWINA